MVECGVVYGYAPKEVIVLIIDENAKESLIPRKNIFTTAKFNLLFLHLLILFRVPPVPEEKNVNFT